MDAPGAHAPRGRALPEVDWGVPGLVRRPMRTAGTGLAAVAGGFACPKCGHGGWAVADGRYKCAACGKRTSVTAGTLFDRRRTPLTVWFTASWMLAAQKDGDSALSRAALAGDRLLPDGVGGCTGCARAWRARAGTPGSPATVEVVTTTPVDERGGRGCSGGRAEGRKSRSARPYAGGCRGDGRAARDPARGPARSRQPRLPPSSWARR